METKVCRTLYYFGCPSTKMILKSSNICLLCLVILVTSQSLSSCHRDRKGHLQPLASHAIKHPILTLNGFPNPLEFLTNYVYPSVPVIFKKGASRSPAFLKWTDKYLGNLPESVPFFVDVETRKVENRSAQPTTIAFREFLKQYWEHDVYLVTTVPDFLGTDVYLPPPLLCDELLKNIIDKVMWFSSGGTKSVIHNDNVDNINCLFSGTKEILFINTTKYRNQMVFDHPEGSYMGTDIESVDFDKYPQFEDVEFYHASLSAGDCLFIPYKWIHQVNSSGRNIAVNIWWEHRMDYTPTPANCGTPCPNMSLADITPKEPQPEIDLFTPFIQYFDANYNEEEFMENIKTFAEFRHMEWSEDSLITARGVFNYADINKDGQLTKQDFTQLEKDDHSITMLEQQLFLILDFKFEQDSRRQLEVLKTLQTKAQQAVKEEL